MLTIKIMERAFLLTYCLSVGVRTNLLWPCNKSTTVYNLSRHLHVHLITMVLILFWTFCSSASLLTLISFPGSLCAWCSCCSSVYRISEHSRKMSLKARLHWVSCNVVSWSVRCLCLSWIDKMPAGSEHDIWLSFRCRKSASIVKSYNLLSYKFELFCKTVTTECSNQQWK